jgi:predicted flavoprotein YhiN
MVWDMAQSFGHSIVPPVPSLFTLNAKHQIKEGQVFCNLAGVSVPHAKATLQIKFEERKKKKVLEQEGPLLVTHHGLTEPVVLRLSAFAAREYHCTYHYCPYGSNILLFYIFRLANTFIIRFHLYSETYHVKHV